MWSSQEEEARLVSELVQFVAGLQGDLDAAVARAEVAESRAERATRESAALSLRDELGDVGRRLAESERREEGLRRALESANVSEAAASARLLEAAASLEKAGARERELEGEMRRMEVCDEGERSERRGVVAVLEERLVEAEARANEAVARGRAMAEEAAREARGAAEEEYRRALDRLRRDLEEAKEGAGGGQREVREAMEKAREAERRAEEAQIRQWLLEGELEEARDAPKKAAATTAKSVCTLRNPSSGWADSPPDDVQSDKEVGKEGTRTVALEAELEGVEERARASEVALRCVEGALEDARGRAESAERRERASKAKFEASERRCAEVDARVAQLEEVLGALGAASKRQADDTRGVHAWGGADAEGRAGEAEASTAECREAEERARRAESRCQEAEGRAEEAEAMAREAEGRAEEALEELAEFKVESRMHSERVMLRVSASTKQKVQIASVTAAGKQRALGMFAESCRRAAAWRGAYMRAGAKARRAVFARCLVTWDEACHGERDGEELEHLGDLGI